MIRLKRAYDPPSVDDDCRILVERLWPRGLTKERAAIELWLKELAPSPELRRWYGHDPEKWPAFRQRYWEELQANPQGIRQLRELVEQKQTVTFVYAARDVEHNSALVLRDFVMGELRE